MSETDRKLDVYFKCELCKNDTISTFKEGSAIDGNIYIKFDENGKIETVLRQRRFCSYCFKVTMHFIIGVTVSDDKHDTAA